MKVLIVEDEGVMALFLKQCLLNLGHKVLNICNNAQSCLESLKVKQPDLILMDILIKGEMDGIQLANTITSKYDSKIVFITSYKESQVIKDAQASKPLGYLIKPIAEHDLEATLMIVQNVLRNDIKITCSNSIDFSNYQFILDENQLYSIDGARIKLSKKELHCLELLVKNIDRHVSHEQLFSHIWAGENYNASSLRELIYRLRKKLPHTTILSTPEIGYSLQS